MAYKVTILVDLLFYAEYSVVILVMCFCLCILLSIAISSASGTTWTTLESLDLLSSWESLRKNMLTSTGMRIDELSNVSFCLKWISVAWLVHISAFNGAAFSLIFEDMPASVFSTLKWFGLVPQNLLAPMFWQIVFFPLEILTLLPPMVATAFNFYIFLAGMGMLRFCADELR